MKRSCTALGRFGKEKYCAVLAVKKREQGLTDGFTDSICTYERVRGIGNPLSFSWQSNVGTMCCGGRVVRCHYDAAVVLEGELAPFPQGLHFARVRPVNNHPKVTPGVSSETLSAGENPRRSSRMVLAAPK